MKQKRYQEKSIHFVPFASVNSKVVLMNLNNTDTIREKLIKKIDYPWMVLLLKSQTKKLRKMGPPTIIIDGRSL